MGKLNLKDRLRKGLFLLDGAMGTQLIGLGIEPGKCSELLNFESPGLVLRIHNSYLNAGSDAIITNTFGGSGIALARHGLEERVADINSTGASCRKAAGQDKICSRRYRSKRRLPRTTRQFEARPAKGNLYRPGKGVIAGGVDGFIIETMGAVDEAVVAVEAVKHSGSNLPVLASMSFDKRGDDFRTMMGVDVKTAVSSLVAAGADAVGFNCGTTTLDEYVDLAKRYVATAKAVNPKVIVFAEPNAGKPELLDGKAVYKVTPDEFAEAAQKIYAAGITIIGGCCGTSPAHIEAVSKKLRS